jgi:ATP synthase protein I
MARNLALIGTLGWLVVTPTLLGLFAGRWIDRHEETGIFWTAALLVAGVAVGCRLAWKRIGEE